MIIFENDGEIDIRFISTFGCSVKESKNPIGFFGTGLKFGIAVLARTGHDIKIQCGKNQLSINLSKSEMRGKEFDFVMADQSPLGFTTELGKTWEVWMAYRELYCNSKDEMNSKIYESSFIPAPCEGKTRIIVSGFEIESAHRDREEFILQGSYDFKIGSFEVFNRPSNSFFYRGIKVMSFQKPALFTYNQTEQVQLTEDRTAKDPYGVIYSISQQILKHAERPVLEKVLTAEIDNLESGLDYHGWSVPVGRDFFPTICELQKSKLAKINSSALRLWRESGSGIISPRRVNLTNVQFEMLERAISFCEKSGFPLRGEFPIIAVETLGESGALAMADLSGKQILLSERIFNQGGTKGVARALIEEYIHLRFDLKDETRAMQNFIFDKMVSLAEELTGEPL